MGGALLNLVASGELNKIVNGNPDKTFFKALSDHIEIQKKEFQVPPMEVRSNEEQLKEGAPETFEVPIVFDQSNFFA